MKQLQAKLPCVRCKKKKDNSEFRNMKSKVNGKDGVCKACRKKEYNENFGSLGIGRLTPLECERLQGFPDGWTEGVSDTQRYKQLGNAVTVNVVYEVAKRLI